MKIPIILLLSAFVVAGCKTNKPAADGGQTQSACREMMMLEKPLDSLRFDHYTIDSIAIREQCLEIVVSYGGGCGDATFDLYLTNRVMESMPPKTVLYLTFTDNDACRSIVKKKLKFNLKPYKRFADRGGIYLKIAGTDKSVLYQIPK